MALIQPFIKERVEGAMQVNCPNCFKEYQIPEKITISDDGTLMHCGSCKNHFLALPTGLTILSGSPVGTLTDVHNAFNIPEVPFQLENGNTLQEGRLEVKDYLGRGSIGSVYRVFDRKLNTDLALKVIIAPDGLENDIFNRLAQRLKAPEKIKRSNYLLKTYLPFVEEFKGLTLVLLPMALVSEGNLRTWINKNADIQKRKEEALAIFREICLAVIFLHDARLFHLNLKPENIFIIDGSIIISDLGLFRNQYERQSIGWPLDCHGDDKYLPIYLAPEQIESPHSHDIDHRSDIFALGCILFELLEGAPAYTGNLWSINKRLWMDKPRLRNADKYMIDVVWNCIEIDPFRRFNEVNQLLDSLKPRPKKNENSLNKEDQIKKKFEEICSRFYEYRNASGHDEKFFHSIVKWVPDALNILKEKALQDHPEALYMLGLLYYLGDEIDKDEVEALRLWKLSGGKEHGPAQYAVAICLDKGHGCQPNQKGAFVWYLKAAEQDIVEAQYDVGDCYFYGNGVLEDKLEAVNWYHRAAKKGHAESQCNLGYCYLKGIGVPENKIEASKWLNLSSSQGNQNAKNILKDILSPKKNT